MERLHVGIFVGLILGLALVLSSFAEMLVVALFGAIGWIVVAVVDGRVDLESLTSRGASRRGLSGVGDASRVRAGKEPSPDRRRAGGGDTRSDAGAVTGAGRPALTPLPEAARSELPVFTSIPCQRAISRGVAACSRRVSVSNTHVTAPGAQRSAI